MSGRISQRLLLTFLCALALVLIPLSSALAQQDPQYRTNASQDAKQQSQDAKQQSDVNTQNQSEREKPTKADPNATQNRDTSTRTNQNEVNRDANADQGALPSTAGELPLLALIGALSLVAAAATRLGSRSSGSR